MFARMATFQVSDIDRMVGMAERIRDAAMSTIEGLTGWQGATQMVDRSGGKLVVGHYFDTEENMQAAEETFETMPQRFPEDLRQEIQQIAGGRQSVEKFEVLADTRPGG